MIQDNLFLQNERNQWFKIKKEVLELKNKFDFTSYLIKSVAEIDTLTKDVGILVIADFMPDFQQSRF